MFAYVTVCLLDITVLLYIVRTQTMLQVGLFSFVFVALLKLMNLLDLIAVLWFEFNYCGFYFPCLLRPSHLPQVVLTFIIGFSYSSKGT